MEGGKENIITYHFSYHFIILSLTKHALCVIVVSVISVVSVLRSMSLHVLLEFQEARTLAGRNRLWVI